MDDELNIEVEEEFYISRDMYICCLAFGLVKYMLRHHDEDISAS